VRGLIVAGLLWLAAGSLESQTIPSGGYAFFAPRLDSVRNVESHKVAWFRSVTAQKFSPIASAILPGSGQYMLGDDRFIGYLAVEVLSWLQYSKNVREQAAQEAQYKSLARRVARASFASGSPDQLPDAEWAYYEKMRDYAESGQYSLTAVGLAPETNVDTYNGSRWALAQATFSTREAALAEYMRTAVRPEYEWSWTNAKLQWDRYIRTTDKRNDASRAWGLNLMVIGANHALSMIDAFTTIRLRATTDRAGVTSVGAAISW
jgi:hypothetical protein